MSLLFNKKTMTGSTIDSKHVIYRNSLGNEVVMLHAKKNSDGHYIYTAMSRDDYRPADGYWRRFTNFIMSRYHRNQSN